ncbi:hypothetical protein Pmani_015588 [Petrolisthes manimaculis]|uniref:Uncharacterized protein n=1 Tax=Petrolisthes manimaculis TaxID=1843537 RepID=A0AAE1UBX8_9EUCA|nr:hypothetical protein Pmani_015588 [Petrolisthes manimaculis]
MFVLVCVLGVALAVPQSYDHKEESLPAIPSFPTTFGGVGVGGGGIPDTSNLANLLERMISASAKAAKSSSASQTPEDRQKDAQTLAQSLDHTIVFLERLSQISRQQQSGGSYQ